jgi:hypothetical protein
MFEIIKNVLPYITGLWTLPWIFIGFIVTFLFSRLFGEQKINEIMRKIGLTLLYIFVPLLLFRILLGVDFYETQIIFTFLCIVILFLMYGIAYIYASFKSKKMDIVNRKKTHYVITLLTNQGRSSAFVGGAMLAIEEWRIFATIYMIISALFLFAIIPYILSYIHKINLKSSKKYSPDDALPWYLKIFPWYLLIFAITGVTIRGLTGIELDQLGDIGLLFTFFTSLTIPAALYYVGAGIHPRDIVDMVHRLTTQRSKTGYQRNWIWTKHIFFLTVILTPLLTICIFGFLLVINLILKEWFAVIVINSILPITSTNMLLVPYGIDKKVTALSITWTTLVCVPLVVVFMIILKISFS